MSQSAKEMLRWIPPYYSESDIYKEQNTAKGKEIDILKYIIDDLKSQFSPKYATWGLSFWEQLCGISPTSSDTLEERRRKVITKMSTNSPFAPSDIVNRIMDFTGSTSVNIYYTNWQIDGNVKDVIKNSHLRQDVERPMSSYIVDIEIARGMDTAFKYGEIYDLIAELLPAHLGYRVIVKYSKSVVISAKNKRHYYEYKTCGLTPDVALVGKKSTKTMVSDTSRAITNHSVVYQQSGKKETGINPDPSLIADINSKITITESDMATTSYGANYSQCGTMVASSGV